MQDSQVQKSIAHGINEPSTQLILLILSFYPLLRVGKNQNWLRLCKALTLCIFMLVLKVDNKSV